MTQNSIKISIVAPFYGSSDDTWKHISEVSKDFPQVVGVRLSRNFGHQGALLAGLNEAKGKAVLSMDGDLQHPPESIPEFIAAWKAGSEVVLSRRLDCSETSTFKKLTSKYFYRFFSSIADTEIEAGSSDFRLLDRKPLNELLKLKYGEPFLRGAVNTLGFSVTTVDYTAHKRFSGSSKYDLSKMLLFAKQGLISHSTVPLKLGIHLGILTGALSIMELIYVVVQALRGETVPGWASTLGVISLLFSVLFVVLGVIGLYLVDIHRLLKQTPHYIAKDIISSRTQP